MTTENAFTWWEAALAGHRTPINVNEPQTGYYKTRGRDDRMAPVAFWYTQGVLRCRVDNAEVLPDRALELWPFASKSPVSYEDYTTRIETGKWMGESEAVIGHNAAPPDNSPDALSERLNDLAREADKLIAAGAATSDAISDQASDLANTFGEIEGKIKDLHKAEKEPHLEAGRAVDRKWFTLRDRAEDLKRRLKAVVVTPWLRKKDEDARAAKVAAIRAGAEPESLPQVRTTAGSSKRSTALRTQINAEVTDWRLLITNLTDHPDLRDAAQRIANASAKAGVELPGMKIVKQKVAA